MTKKEFLNSLYKECDLSKEDVFENTRQRYTIITRSGIEKIQSKYDIQATFELSVCNINQVVVKGRFTKPNTPKESAKFIETFGEWNDTHANYKTDKQTGIKQMLPFYSVALAEKRCLSRGVLKIMGLYKYGVFGEDETMYETYE